ncbi:MAG TPA: DMT family transporter [Steroidobacteraceae bacterium]|nr:DMT family transporter [Steroidobacteraceae bacterium]
MKSPAPLWTATLAAAAMCAFAANSLLCRLALGPRLIDAATFTSVRLVSGALLLAALVAWRQRARPWAAFDPWAALALFVYAIAFSYAYLSLTAGTGALVLFGAVQITMILFGLVSGERLTVAGWSGLAVAFAGLVYLVAPGLDAPPFTAALLMAVAGLAWGVYSLRGRGVPDPLRATASNFIWSVPLAVLSSALLSSQYHATTRGVALAVASGAVASGLGYVIWYAAVRRLAAVRAAAVQLSVPVIAAFGGILLLGEELTARLALSSVTVLGGIAMVLYSRAPAAGKP